MARRKHRQLDYKSTGTGEIVRVPTQGHSETAAGVLQFLAVLAYPHAEEKEVRDLFATAMHAVNWKVSIWDPGKNKHDSAAVRKLLPQDARQRIRRIQGKLNKGFKRITRRLNAGNMAARFYYQGTRIPYETPSPSGSVGIEIVGPDSIRKALLDVVRVKEEHGTHRERDDAAENERKHMWLPSMPVLHLCLVLFAIVNGFPEGTPGEAMYLDLVRRPEWLHDALLRAEIVRKRMHECVQEFDPEKALRLLPSESVPPNPA
jgi:hypothetical protein